MIKRTEKLLNQYEEKLMLVDKYLNRKNKVDMALNEIDALINEGNDKP